MRKWPFLPKVMGGILAVGILATGCQATHVLSKPALENEGELYVYLSPLPPDAGRLDFSLEGIAAVRDDGRDFPLVLSLRRINRSEAGRERLLAAGPLPPGRFVALSVKARDASLTTEEGAAALTVPEEPARTEISFAVQRRKGIILSLSLNFRESIAPGFRFRPAFAAATPAAFPLGLNGFVTNRGSNNIMLFDKVAGAVFKVIPSGTAPAGIVLGKANRSAFVALSEEDAIEVLDVLAGEVTDRIPLAGGDGPLELGMTPDGGRLLSVNSGSDTLSVIDPDALIEESRIPVGNGPESILIDGAGRRAYVLNTLSDTISVVDLPGRRVVATVPTDPAPVRAQFNREGSRLYVVHRSSPFLIVFDVSSLAALKRVFVGSGASAMKVDSRTDRIYLARLGANRIEIYDPSVTLPVDFIRTEGDVDYMTIDDEQNNLVVLRRRRIEIVRLINKEVTARIDVGEAPYWVTVTGGR